MDPIIQWTIMYPTRKKKRDPWTLIDAPCDDEVTASYRQATGSRYVIHKSTEEPQKPTTTWHHLIPEEEEHTKDANKLTRRNTTGEQKFDGWSLVDTPSEDEATASYRKAPGIAYNKWKNAAILQRKQSSTWYVPPIPEGEEQRAETINLTMGHAAHTADHQCAEVDLPTKHRKENSISQDSHPDLHSCKKNEEGTDHHSSSCHHTEEDRVVKQDQLNSDLQPATQQTLTSTKNVSSSFSKAEEVLSNEERVSKGYGEENVSQDKEIKEDTGPCYQNDTKVFESDTADNKLVIDDNCQSVIDTMDIITDSIDGSKTNGNGEYSVSKGCKYRKDNENKEDTGPCSQNDAKVFESDTADNKTVTDDKCQSVIDKMDTATRSDSIDDLKANGSDQEPGYESEHECSEDNQHQDKECANTETEMVEDDVIKQEANIRQNSDTFNIESVLDDDTEPRSEVAVQVNFDEERQILTSIIPLKDDAQNNNHVVKVSPKGSEWIIPEILFNDDRLELALPQLAKSVNPNITIQSLPSNTINITHTGRVIIPCVAASRIGSDLQAAVQKAALGAVVPIVLIFNHLAPHMSRIRTATKDRLSDRKLVNSCLDVIDVVYWNRSMYECEANTKAIKQLKSFWNIK